MARLSPRSSQNVPVTRPSGTLPASHTQSIAPILPPSVKRCPRRKSLLRERLTAAGSPLTEDYRGRKNAWGVRLDHMSQGDGCHLQSLMRRYFYASTMVAERHRTRRTAVRGIVPLAQGPVLSNSVGQAYYVTWCVFS